MSSKPFWKRFYQKKTFLEKVLPKDKSKPFWKRFYQKSKAWWQSPEATVARKFKKTRDGAEEACLAHNQEVVGSKPTSANKFFNWGV